MVLGVCLNLNTGKTDENGNSCQVYQPEMCKTSDDGDFKSEKLCCARGGGKMIKGKEFNRLLKSSFMIKIIFYLHTLMNDEYHSILDLNTSEIYEEPINGIVKPQEESIIETNTNNSIEEEDQVKGIIVSYGIAFVIF